MILLGRDFPKIRIQSASKEPRLTFKDYIESFKIFIRNKKFDFAIVEYIELTGILEFLPDETTTLLDVHDLVFQKMESFRKCGVAYDGIELTRQEELNIFDCYDYVILIQKEDLEIVSKFMSLDRLVLAPHPVRAKKMNIRKKARNVGYVASSYIANIEALRWFMDNVWKKILAKNQVFLNIYGNIKYNFLPSGNRFVENTIFHGFIDHLETIYSNSDIIVNPVRCGAGLKIKNVEALGNGLPLVTTTHGAAGLGHNALECLLIADEPYEYANAFNMLLRNYQFRKRLAKKAFEFAVEHFSDRKCYKGLVDIIC